MKILIYIILICSGCISVFAQNTDEWLEQKKTQKKYLLKQISELRLYLKALEKGYRIAQTGLETVNNIKNGDFKLHTQYFESLKNVNPVIARYQRVADIIAAQKQVVKLYGQLKKELLHQPSFSKSERQYILAVFVHLVDRCSEDIESLVALTTSGKLQLKDNERIDWINRIYSSVQEKQEFARNFYNQVARLNLNRSTELSELKHTKAVYGVKD